MTNIASPPLPAPLDGAFHEPLHLGPIRITETPVPYRAYPIGRWRFAWAGPGVRFRLSTVMIPSNYALTLELLPNGDWRLVDMKAFETGAEARGWAESLWRSEVARRARAS